MPKFTSYKQGTPCWVELMTPDQRGAADFYAALFGWHVEVNPIDDEGHVYLMGTLEGSSVAGITGQMPELEGHPAFWSVYLACDDVDAAAVCAAEAGGEVEMGPFDVMEHGRMVALKDPTGARVNLWQAGKHPGTSLANQPGTPIWNELVTPAPEVALPFYEKVLGITAQTSQMADGSYTTLFVDGAPVGGCLPPMMEGMPPHWNVYFNVEDVDDTVSAAEKKGGRVLAPAFDVDGIGRLGFIADPRGGMVCLMGEAQPAA